MEETTTTKLLNKKVLQDQLFNNKEYDQQFKKEMKEMWSIADNNPFGAEMLLKTLHKNLTKAIKNKDKADELHWIHRFYFLMTYAKWTNKLNSESWDRINQELSKDWQGILY